MDRIIRNENRRTQRQARRFVDLCYSGQRLNQSSRQINSVPTVIDDNIESELDESPQQSNSVPESINGSFDMYREEIFELLSDSSDDEEEPTAPVFDLRKELREWVINAKIPAYHVDKLLLILRNISPNLPKCCKTLRHTPRESNIVIMDNGHYFHTGLKSCLNRFLSNNDFKGNCIKIDVNIDGVGVSKSSTSDIWPILVSVVGYENVLMVGAFHGTSKPQNVNNYLKRFVDEFNELKNNFCYQNKMYRLQIRAVVADVPARTYILDSIGHTGYSSCTKCTIKGEREFNTTFFAGFDFELRTDSSVRNREDEHHHHSMEPTILESLPIDCVDDVIVDVMHCVYLGVMKLLLLLWIVNRRELYSMSVANIRKLSAEILHISHQLPNEFSRFPRPLKYLKRYKATEFRQFLLYTLPVLLKDKIPKIYYDNFLKLHVGMRILCDPGQCIINNELASKLLKAFVKDFEELYGRYNVTFNVHSLLHITADVIKINATVEDYSAFKFENYLQYVKSLPRTGYKVLEQMYNRIWEKNGIENYSGDFTKKQKLNKLIKNTNLFVKVYVFNMILSPKAPDNYVIIEENVYKIEEIYQMADGNFKIKCWVVQDLNPLYVEPICSTNLNSFFCKNEKLSETCFQILSKNIRKCAAFNLDGIYVYIGMLH